MDTFYKHFLKRHPQPDYVTAYQGRKGLKLSTVVYLGMWGPGEIHGTGTLRNYNGESLLGELAVPTLVMCGEYDEMSPAATAPFVKRIRGARLVTVQDSGHEIPLDQPARYVEIIRNHLARTDDSQSTV